MIIRLSTEKHGQVRWTVIDRGPGIGPEEQERLFERFFVGTSDRHEVGGGSGLGLPTALAIAPMATRCCARSVHSAPCR